MSSSATAHLPGAATTTTAATSRPGSRERRGSAARPHATNTGGGGGHRVQPTNHLVVGPLLILSSVAVVFILYQGRDVLVPFVIALFLTYLLRPIVYVMTTPFEVCRQKLRRATNYTRAPHDAGGGSGGGRSLSGDVSDVVEEDDDDDVSISGAEGGHIASDDDDDADEETGLLSHTEKYTQKRASTTGSINAAPHLSFKTPTTSTTSTSATAASLSAAAAVAPMEGCCEGCLQLPHPAAVLVTMVVAISVLGVGLILVADTVRGFEEEDLIMYKRQGSLLLNSTLFWVKGSFQVDGTYLLQQIVTRIPVSDLFQGVILFCVNTMANIFWILLFVLYLLFEQTKPAAGDNASRQTTYRHKRARAGHRRLREQIDEQIQRYLGLKTLVSAAAAVSVWLLLGPMLRVRMAHLFAIFTFFLNFIPNAGPLLATFLPLPIVILDPSLLPISKVLAIVGPIFIHGVIGNIIEPAVFGASLELHPVMVLLALAFWYLVWGSAGAILSVPITAVMRIVLLHTDGVYAQSCLSLLEGRLHDVGRLTKAPARSMPGSPRLKGSPFYNGGGGGGGGRKGRGNGAKRNIMEGSAKARHFKVGKARRVGESN